MLSLTAQSLERGLGCAKLLKAGNVGGKLEMPFCVEGFSPDSRHFVFIEDDGKVAYAYLYENDDPQNIIGDVWLYNCGAAPAIPEWTDREALPFANPQDFAMDNNLGPLVDVSMVSLDWRSPEAGLAVHISLHGMEWAVLAPGSKPGWCRLAKKKGPLANPLDDYRKT